MFVVGNNAATTEYRDYFNRTISDGSARVRLLSAVHHTHDRSHSGNIIRLMLETANIEELKAEHFIEADEEHKNTNTFANRDISKIIDVDSNDFIEPSIYFSLNEFAGIRRTADKCYCVTSLFIDIDGHGLAKEELKQEIEKAQHILNDAYNDGTLLVPSKITFSGRGLGIFYILDRSIAITENTKKLLKFYDAVYGWLLKAYADLLKDTKLDVDTVVRDRARVCRMPDTFNYKADEYCRLYDTEDIYYTLKDINEGCHLEKFVMDKAAYYESIGYKPYKADLDHFKDSSKKSTTNSKKVSDKAKIVDFDEARSLSLNNSRIKFFFNLQSEMNENGVSEGNREELCFLFYNALVQLTDRASAKKQTREFNQNFINPLKEKELKQAFTSVDDNEKGYYMYSSIKIAEALKLDYKEASRLGLLVNSSDFSEETKRKNEEKRTKREGIINALKLANMGLKRESLLEIINKELESNNIKPISSRTLDRLLKKNGYGRAGTLAYEETAEYKKDEARKQAVREKRANKIVKFESKNIELEKLPKKTEYCSVPQPMAIIPFENILHSYIGIEGLIHNLYAFKFTELIIDKLISKFNEMLSFLSNSQKKDFSAGINFINLIYSIEHDNNKLIDAVNHLLMMITPTEKHKVSVKYDGIIVPKKIYASFDMDAYTVLVNSRKVTDTDEETIVVPDNNSVPYKSWKSVRYDWIQDNSDFYCKTDYYDIAATYRYLMANLKKGSELADGFYKVGTYKLKGSDIRDLLDKLTLDEIKNSVEFEEVVIEDKMECPFDSDITLTTKDVVPVQVEQSHSAKIEELVLSWLETVASRTGVELNSSEDVKARKITVVCRYCKHKRAV